MERQVEQVFFLIAYGGITGRAELLGMLQAVVKVNIIKVHMKSRVHNGEENI